jgi:hypothetical protein
MGDIWKLALMAFERNSVNLRSTGICKRFIRSLHDNRHAAVFKPLVNVRAAVTDHL